MSDIEVEGPDGSVITFPAGTSHDVMAQAMQKHYASAPSVAGSFGRGTVRGASFGMSDEAAGLAAAAPSILGRQEQERQARDVSAGLPTIPDPVTLIAGGVRRLFGGGEAEYNAAVKQQRDMAARDRETNPWASVAGEVAGGIAVPMGSINSAAQAAKVGAGAGVAYGFGESEGLENSAIGAAKGAGVGGALGGALGAIAGRSGPKPPSGVAEAAQRQGVEIPKFVASDSTAVQRLAQAERNIPFAGDTIAKSFQSANASTGQALANAGASAGATSAREAGEAAAEGIKNYVGPKLSEVSARAYGRVDELVSKNADVAHPLEAAQRVASEIIARRRASGTDKPGAAVNAIMEALNRPEGLTYAGIKDLRSRFGAHVTDDLVADVSGAEFKRLYGALTDDLKSAVRASGGEEAVKSFEHANAIHRLASQRREALEKVIGSDGMKRGEDVFSRIEAMASGTSRGDAVGLATARKAMGPEAWGEIAGTVVTRLGRDAEGNFSPDRFLTAYGKFSPEGRKMLFAGNGNLQQSLDDIATISSRMSGMKQFGNSSGTTQTLISGSALIGGNSALGIADPLTTVGLLLGNKVLSSVLASPASASSMAKWSKTYEALVRYPGKASLAAFNQASKNFASTVGDKVGATLAPADFLRAAQGVATSRASEE